MNIVHLSGYVSKAEEVPTRTGTKMAKCVLIYEEKKRTGNVEHNIECVCFGGAASRVLAAAPGTPILLVGKLEANPWTGKDGVARNFLKLVVVDAELVLRDVKTQAAPPAPSTPREEAPPPRQVAPPKQEQQGELNYDEIPF